MIFKITHVIKKVHDDPKIAKQILQHEVESQKRNRHAWLRKKVEDEIEEELPPDPLPIKENTKKNKRKKPRHIKRSGFVEAPTQDAKELAQEYGVHVKDVKPMHPKEMKKFKPQKSKELQNILRLQINEFKKKYRKEFNEFMEIAPTKAIFLQPGNQKRFQELKNSFEQEKSTLIKALNQARITSLKKELDSYVPWKDYWNHSS